MDTVESFIEPIMITVIEIDAESIDLISHDKTLETFRESLDRLGLILPELVHLIEGYQLEPGGEVFMTIDSEEPVLRRWDAPEKSPNAYILHEDRDPSPVPIRPKRGTSLRLTHA